MRPSRITITHHASRITLHEITHHKTAPGTPDHDYPNLPPRPRLALPGPRRSARVEPGASSLDPGLPPSWHGPPSGNGDLVLHLPQGGAHAAPLLSRGPGAADPGERGPLPGPGGGDRGADLDRWGGRREPGDPVQGAGGRSLHPRDALGG